MSAEKKGPDPKNKGGFFSLATSRFLTDLNLQRQVRKEHPETHQALRQPCHMLEDRIIRSAETKQRNAATAAAGRNKGCHCGATVQAKCKCQRPGT